MFCNEVGLTIFLCAGFKNCVWGECRRLGSFGRKRFFADVLLKKDQNKARGKRGPPSCFGTFPKVQLRPYLLGFDLSEWIKNTARQTLI